MRSFARSETGKVRLNNEDNYAIKDFGKTRVMVLADGMGGVEGGEVASKIAVDSVVSMLTNDLGDSIDSMDEEKLKDELSYFFSEANKNILKHAISNSELDGMGTTLTVVVIKGRRILVGHIGDCRVYLFHGSSMTQLTNDHTFAAELFRNSSITREEMRNHPGRHKLVKCLGDNSYVSPDFYGYNIIYGDMVLLCTDGLYSVMEDSEILNCCRKHNDLEGSLNNLFEAAYKAGSEDNITALITHIIP